MTDILPEQETMTDYSPEERALILRLRVYVNMRWLAIPAIIIATLVASMVFHIGFPTLPVYVICAIIALYNFLLFRWTQGLKRQKPELVIRRVEAYGNAQVILDMVMLTVLL